MERQRCPTPPMERDGCGMAMQWPKEERKERDGATVEAGGGGEGTGSVASVKGVPSGREKTSQRARWNCGKPHKTSDPRAEEVRRNQCLVRPDACPCLVHGDAPTRWTIAPFQSTHPPPMRVRRPNHNHNHNPTSVCFAIGHRQTMPGLRSWKNPEEANSTWPRARFQTWRQKYLGYQVPLPRVLHLE